MHPSLLIDVLGVALADDTLIKEYMNGTPAPIRPRASSNSAHRHPPLPPIPKIEERSAPSLTQTVSLRRILKSGVSCSKFKGTKV